MRGLRCTLLGDGPSDRVLLPIIRWTLHRLGTHIEQEAWADLSFLKTKPPKLRERVSAALRYYPCDVLFVHRDAERDDPIIRLEEIRVAADGQAARHVPVVPVRMTEAWFLHDERAIRSASGNPRGTVALALPRPRDVESVADPKQVLLESLLAATELAGRRRERKKRDLQAMRTRVAELIVDFAPLEMLPAFRQFVEAARVAVKAVGSG